MTTTSQPPSSVRPTKIWHWFFVLAMVAGGAFGVASSLGFSWAALPPPVVIALALVIVTAAMAGSVMWMRDIDELARQAHYVAWFWGGSSALCALIFVILAAPVLPGLVDFPAIEHRLAPFAGEGGGFIAGVVASLFALMFGYGVWWTVFWLRKR